ncbi:hypothetical protein AOLI_G00103580 [Acnodon oligacanthus]
MPSCFVVPSSRLKPQARPCERQRNSSEGLCLGGTRSAPQDWWNIMEAENIKAEGSWRDEAAGEELLHPPTPTGPQCTHTITASSTMLSLPGTVGLLSEENMFVPH